ncbi:MAG: hypothetical protein AMXMBFR56_31370 [Polyangiaceae bacterium]
MASPEVEASSGCATLLSEGAAAGGLTDDGDAGASRATGLGVHDGAPKRNNGRSARAFDANMRARRVQGAFQCE